MKKLTPNNISRKKFLKTSFLAACFLPFLQYCSKAVKSFIVKISGTNHILGHQLWAKKFPKPTETSKHKFIIVGAGISGLSAARILKKNGIEDFLVLEMENHFGGNSSNGENKYSKFPLGAHYLPIPNKEDVEIIEFLREFKMYLGDDENGLPILDDYQLTFPKEERLFFKNFWQNDLVPLKGISEETKKEIEIFFKMMDQFRTKKDALGKYWFDIPLNKSCDDGKNLDELTFADWLSKNNFKSEELLWLLDYSCKDDYGLGIQYVSAWAGIHYFAGRKNNWATNRTDQVFTWPEGNARLAKHLEKFTEDKKLTNHLVFSVENNEKVEVLAFDNSKKISKKIIAEKVLFATPQFVNQHLLKGRNFKNFQYVASVNILKIFNSYRYFFSSCHMILQKIKSAVL